MPSPNLGNMVEPPENTTLAYKSLLVSMTTQKHAIPFQNRGAFSKPVELESHAQNADGSDLGVELNDAKNPKPVQQFAAKVNPCMESSALEDLLQKLVERHWQASVVEKHLHV